MTNKSNPYDTRSTQRALDEMIENMIDGNPDFDSWEATDEEQEEQSLLAYQALIKLLLTADQRRTLGMEY